MEQLHNLLDMLESSVRKFGERPALWDPNDQNGYDTWTYQDLWSGIRRFARRLAEAGITAGDRVGLLATSRSWWPVCDFGIMSLSACTVPIYPSLPSNQMDFIIHHSGMKGLILQDSTQLRKVLEIPPQDIPDLQFVVVLDSDLPDEVRVAAESRFAVHDYRKWMAASFSGWDEGAWKKQWSSLSDDHVATIVYTSGTTGQPKGVELTHGNLVSNVVGIADVVQLVPSDRSLSYLPLSHIFERTCGEFYPFYVGSSVAYARGFAQIVEDFQRMPPTVMTTVPRLLEKIQETVTHQVELGPAWRKKVFHKAMELGTKARLLNEPVSRWQLALFDRLVFGKLRRAMGGRLRSVIVGGAPMPNYVGTFFTAAGLSVAEGYGMTETSPVVSANRPDAPRLGTAGVLLPNVRVKIADDGEILVQAPSVMRGYYQNEEATAEAFTEDGWLHTGDVGVLTEDGYLQITDRKKNLLVLSTGKKVTPAPIEGEILKNPYIDQVLLVGQGRKYVSAIVVPNDAALRERFAQLGKSMPSRETWNANEDVVSFLFHQMEDCIQDFARFEQPKKLLIADEPFTVENEQLTPTLKVRSKNVLAAYADAIERLYAD